MSAQQKKITSPKESSIVELLEGRQLFSASLDVATDAALAYAAAPPQSAATVEVGQPVATTGKVSTNDFHFVQRNNSSSQGLRIRLEDVLVSTYGVASSAGSDTGPSAGPSATGKVSTQDISFVTRVNKSSPML